MDFTLHFCLDSVLKQYIMSENEEVSFTSMKCILQIVSFHDSKLSALFRSLEEIHFLAFCVSWVLTWFAHEVQDFRVIARIYDYCLCGPESVALYLSAAVVLSLKDGLLNEVGSIGFGVFCCYLVFTVIFSLRYSDETDNLLIFR